MPPRRKDSLGDQPLDGAAPPPDGSTGQEPFEVVFARLEETVRALEEGNLSLDAALRLYEEGAALVQRCGTMLDAAELRVTRLRNRYSGLGAERGEGDAAEES